MRRKEENKMKIYPTKNLKPYIPDKGFRYVNGMDIFHEDDIDVKIKNTENLIKEMNETNRKMSRTIYHWNKMIDLLQVISRDIKEHEKNKVTYIPMFPGNHFRL